MVEASAVRYSLSLHHLTIADAGVEAFVDIAARVGCEQVCLFVDAPEQVRALVPCVATLSQARSVARTVADAGMRMCNVEYLVIDSAFDHDACRPALERAMTLGARRATVQVRHPDPERAADALARLQAVAAEFGIALGLEFTGMSAVRTINAAQALIEAAGDPHVTIVVDALHLVRTGGTADEVSRCADRIAYAQLCDGALDGLESDYRQEALFDRQAPGEGTFPLVALLRSLSPAVSLSVEAPQHWLMRAGMDADARARRAVEGARIVIARSLERIAT